MRATTHIYIDESISDKASLATLTALFIPVRKLKRITVAYYNVIAKILEKLPKTKNGSRIVYPPIVLHANTFLQNSKENRGIDFSNIIEDDFRIELLSDILKIVVSNRLKIVRLGYNNYNEIKKSIFKDEKMYSTNWLNLSRNIDRCAKINKALCIMEGDNMDMINKFSKFLSIAKSRFYLYPDIAKSSVFSNSKKFIGNVFYVPAQYCEYLQIVDIVSYVLHKRDYIDITGKKTDFSLKVYDLFNLIDNKRLINIVINLSHNTRA